MTTRNLAFSIHPARKGLNTTAPPTLLEPDELVIAENLEYDTSGTRRKRFGTARYNATAITTSPTVTALADFHRRGTCLDATQMFLAHAGTTLYKDDGDGVWDVISSTLSWGTSDSLVDICIAGDYAVFATGDQGALKYDQSTLAALSPDAPYFSFSVYHLERLWAGGYAAAPSRLWYTAAGDISDFAGSDAGTIKFGEGDGDRITGVSKPFQNRLYVFKGTSKGSVWNLSGNTVNTFVKNRMFEAAPCVSHASVVTTSTDIYWVSTHGIHSLQATDKFGDTEQFYLSHPIQDTFRSLNTNGLQYTKGFYHPTRNLIGWAVPEAGTQNSVVLVYNYVLGVWSVWRFTGFRPASVMVASTPGTQRQRVYWGGYDGFVRAGDQTTKADDNGSSYAFTMRTPIYLKMGPMSEMIEKQLYSITTFYRPVAATSSATLSYWLDDAATASTAALTLTTGGSLWDQSLWDQSAWGDRNASLFTETAIEGRCRALQMQWTQSGATQSDIEIIGYAVRAMPAEAMPLAS